MAKCDKTHKTHHHLTNSRSTKYIYYNDITMYITIYTACIMYCNIVNICIYYNYAFYYIAINWLFENSRSTKFKIG